jgi:hypothetical protein
MAASLYTGNNTGQAITNTVNGVSLQPDFLWIKVRSNTYGNSLADSVRGVSASLESNSTAAEVTNSELTSFNSNGFTLGATGSLARNVSGQTYVAWQWKAGGTAITNTSGSITSSVSAGTTQGVSVVTYTGTGANATIGHGLGVAPKMIIAKSRGTAGTNWGVWHTSLTSYAYYLLLNSTAAQATAATTLQALPTSTVVSVGSSSIFNDSSTMVMYCFAEVAGYSKFGSYTGNGSADGPFVYLGFRPRFVMIKRTDSTGNWQIIDTSRSTYNEAVATLYPNLTNAEDLTNTKLDALSNGFKIRGTPSTDFNTNGSTYIYACFAELPFKNSNAR